MEARELKDKAAQLFTKGRFAKAAETYEEFCALEKKDHQARLRCGDAWAKAGKKDKAIGAYALAAEGFAKDGFLPRAIAASKLVLELDPSHKGVQKMLAELYAQKTGGPRPAGATALRSSPSAVAGAPEMEISRSVSAPTSNFTNRKAIDLEAPPPAAKPRPAPPPPPRAKEEPPSPMNRADAIELPKYEIPLDDGPSIVGGMSAQQGPNPTRRADAIELEAERAPASAKPQGLVETSIEIDLTAGAPVTGEVEIPIEGQALPDVEQLPPELQMAAPLAPAAPPAPAPSVPVFELTVEVDAPAAAPAPVPLPPPPAPPSTTSNVYELTDAVPASPPASGSSQVYELGEPVPEPQPSAPVYELTDVEVPAPVPLPPAPAPGPSEPAVATDAQALPHRPPVSPSGVEGREVPAIPGGPDTSPKSAPAPAAPAAPPGLKQAALPAAESPAAAAARPLPPAVGDAATVPPGIKPLSPLPPAVGDAATAPPSIKPVEPAPPGLKPKKPEPAEAPASRIWLPPTFTPPAPVPDASPVAAAPSASAAPPAEPASDLERSLQTFMQFDPDAPAARPAAPAAAAPAPAARTGFTELDLDEADSLLHTVDAAARTAQPAAAPAEEEAMEAPEEARPEPGALPKIPLFSDLPEDAFIALFERCPLQRFDEGQLVFEQGDKADAFYVICGGRVRVFRTDGEQRKELATLDEGSFFGEMALLSEAPRSASVEAAAEDTQVLVISAEILTELSTAHPVVATALKKFCRQRMLSNLMNTAPLFAPFNRNDRRDLVQKFRARDVKRGDVLVKEGTPSDGLYLVLSGEVEVEMKGRRVTTLKEGQVFGEMSLLLRSPASATVRALRHTSLLRLPKQDFDMLILSHPQVLEHVSSLIDERRKSDAARQANDAGELL